jgi:hypothetical protein
MEDACYAVEGIFYAAAIEDIANDLSDLGGQVGACFPHERVDGMTVVEKRTNEVPSQEPRGSCHEICRAHAPSRTREAAGQQVSS